VHKPNTCLFRTQQLIKRIFGLDWFDSTLFLIFVSFQCFTENSVLYCTDFTCNLYCYVRMGSSHKLFRAPVHVTLVIIYEFPTLNLKRAHDL